MFRTELSLYAVRAIVHAKRFSGASEVLLSRRSTERQCDSSKGGQERKRHGQVHDHAANRDAYAGAEFQQPLAQRLDLSTSAVGATSAQSQFLHEHVSRGGQQHAQLVGPEVAATGAVDLRSCSSLILFSTSPRGQ